MVGHTLPLTVDFRKVLFTSTFQIKAHYSLKGEEGVGEGGSKEGRVGAEVS